MSLAPTGQLREARNQEIRIRLRDAADRECSISVRRGRNRNIQISLEGRELGERLQNLAQPYSVYTPGLAGVAREERYLSPGVVRRSVARGDANLVLRNVLFMLLQEDRKYDSFLDGMRELFGEIDFSVQFDNDTDEFIQTQVSFAEGPWLPLESSGTAVLQAAQILGYSALYSPPLVLLDEPDSHLHPNNQRALCRLLKRLVESQRFRLLVATHSRHVLDTLRTSSDILWMSRGESVDTTDSSLVAMLLELGALDSVDYFVDGQFKCVVLTEDADTRALEAVLWASGFEESETRVCSYAGCTKIEAATVLGQFVSTSANSVVVVVHRDSDYCSESDRSDYMTKIANCDLQPFMTRHSDIEGYYLSAEHLVAMCDGLSVSDAQRIIDEATTETRFLSLEAMINLRVAAASKARSATGRQPNPGVIATQCTAEYESDPAKFRRGKHVLGRVISRVQEHTGSNPHLLRPSEHIADTALRQIADTLWPSNP